MMNFIIVIKSIFNQVKTKLNLRKVNLTQVELDWIGKNVKI